MNIIEKYKNGLKNQSSQIIKPINIDKHTGGELIKMIAKEYEPSFEITERNKPFYTLLYSYFTGNPKFSTYLEEITGKKGSLNKGLLIVGPVGVGKSLAMGRIFRKFTSNFRQNSYQVHEYLQIADSDNLKSQPLSDFGQIISKNGTIRDNTKTVLIEDFLTNRIVLNHFGNNINIANDLIYYRYLAYIKSKKLTHFTTNIYPKNLGEKLDYRAVSRLQEMCNIIELNDKNWRSLE